MNKLYLAAALAGTALSLGATPASATQVTYYLTTDGCGGSGCNVSSSSPAGSITITDSGTSTVNVLVDLNQYGNSTTGYGWMFADTGASKNTSSGPGTNAALSFNTDVTLTGVTFGSTTTSGGTVTLHWITPGAQSTPFGNFSQGISCDNGSAAGANSCGNGTSPPDLLDFSFTATDGGTLAVSDFTSSTGGYHFLADLGYYTITDGALKVVQTGLVADGPCTSITTCQPPPSVPEPATLALLGAGLAGMGFRFRRRAS